MRIIKIPHLFRELKSGRIKRGLKNFSYRTIGTFISQIISFIGFIYLARYLGPEYYGIYVTVGAFMGMFKLLAFGGIRRVVIRKCSKNMENATEVYNQTVGLQSFAIFIAIIAMLIGALFSGYETRTILFIAIFSLKLFSNSFKGYINTIYKYSEKMEYLAIFDIVHRLIYVGSIILFFQLGYGIFAVILISALSELISFLIRYYYSKPILKFNIFSKLKFDKNIIKSSFNFSLIQIFSTLHTRTDLFIISLLGPSPEVAIYGVAYQLARETNIIRKTLGESFYPIAVKVLDSNSLRGKKIIKYSLFFGIGMFVLSIIGYILAEPVIKLLFGEEYTKSSHIFRILIFYIVAWFSTLPFSEAVQATGNEKIYLTGKGLMAVLNIPLNIIFYFRYGLIGIAYSTLVVYTIGSIIIIVYSYHILHAQGYIT